MMFDALRRQFARGTRYRDLDREALLRLSARLPKELVELYEEDGLANYGDVLWTVDPQDFEPAMAAWFPVGRDLALFAHGAFGELYLWGDDVWRRPGTPPCISVQIVFPHTGKIDTASPTISMFFARFSRLRWVNEGLLRPLALQAKALVGSLEWDEMYGYEPALALGGSGEPETIRRFKLNEHHILLSQLVKPR